MSIPILIIRKGMPILIRNGLYEPDQKLHLHSIYFILVSTTFSTSKIWLDALPTRRSNKALPFKQLAKAVDGTKPAVDRWFIPLIYRVSTSKLVQDFVDPEYQMLIRMSSILMCFVVGPSSELQRFPELLRTSAFRNAGSEDPPGSGLITPFSWASHQNHNRP